VIFESIERPQGDHVDRRAAATAQEAAATRRRVVIASDPTPEGGR
jgi:hypothetical protein